MGLLRAAQGGSELTRLRAQRLLALAGVHLAPALVAGAIVASHTGRAGDGVLVVFSVLIAARALDPGRRLVQLLPIAGVITRMLVPIGGLTLAWLLTLPFTPLTFADLSAAALGSALVQGLSIWLVARFEGATVIRIAVAGSPRLARRLRNELARTGLPGYEIVGWIDPGAPDNVPELRRLGSFAQLRDIVAREGIDLIVNEGGDQTAVAKIVSEQCLALDVRLTTVSQLEQEVFGEISPETMDAGYFQYLMHPNFRGGSPRVKRAVDLSIALVSLAVAAPIFVLAAIATKVSGNGSVFVREPRVGARGEVFEMLKLRTGDGAFGTVMRRTHLDELAQLVNVLRGEMALVGPRPELPERLADLEQRIRFYDRRVLVAPGVTGWAQVRRADAVAEADSAWKLAHDLYYLKHRSTSLDAMILLQTPFVAAQGLRLGSAAPDERFAPAN